MVHFNNLFLSYHGNKKRFYNNRLHVNLIAKLVSVIGFCLKIFNCPQLLVVGSPSQGTQYEWNIHFRTILEPGDQGFERKPVPSTT